MCVSVCTCMSEQRCKHERKIMKGLSDSTAGSAGEAIALDDQRSRVLCAAHSFVYRLSGALHFSRRRARRAILQWYS